ncbi:heterokaryon incompatibility protein-domain-containing protein [Bisporella sp. PMI_857]|nr:heterokaryon incompatibility protein-domain-containing protein [Bisporella sp. PMI_857]KAH8600545.1 heterokaryon incompatibility protein-domain-containing protein [Bisporella sp. PMI_857]
MPTPLDSLAITAEIVADTRADECAYMASQWITTCHESHLDCQRPPLSLLPTRVIDVGSDYQRECPKLLECGGQTGSYIALSHCWGSGRHFTTETSNISERMKGMTWGSLPKTFQDAISITRKLKIRYLWIDSLCILQDDSADWDKELSKMSDIYKNSYLTIAV